MKLLLTSAGLSNKSIIKALAELIEKPFSELRLAFIPTAANVEEGDKCWLIDDLVICKELGFASIDIVDISAIPRDIWEPRLKKADILMFEGGNTNHLMYWIRKSGLKEVLSEMLTKKVYIGISAGSMVVAGKSSIGSEKSLYLEEIGEYKDEKRLGFVNFYIYPHFNSPYFPACRKNLLEKIAREFKKPMYAIDDQTAIKVIDDKVEVVGDGKYLKFNF